MILPKKSNLPRTDDGQVHCPDRSQSIKHNGGRGFNNSWEFQCISFLNRSLNDSIRDKTLQSPLRSTPPLKSPWWTTTLAMCVHVINFVQIMKFLFFQWLLACCVGRSCVSVVFFYFTAIITPLLPTDEMKEFFVVEEEEDSEAIK